MSQKPTYPRIPKNLECDGRLSRYNLVFQLYPMSAGASGIRDR
jgi:hypothetical protein